MYYNQNTRTSETDPKEMYPEIYNILSPMVNIVSGRNINNKLTPDLLESMTNEIYDSLEADIQEDQTTKTQSHPLNDDMVEVVSRNTGRTRQNTLLRDLISIMLLDRLFGNNPNRPYQQRNQYRQYSPVSNTFPYSSYMNSPYPEDQFYR